MKLIVPMPFDKDVYMEDFDVVSKNNFLELITKSDDIFKVENTKNNPYKSVGTYIVDHCDVLIALWDGTLNQKLGGTGDIVSYAKSSGIELKHFKCERG